MSKKDFPRQALSTDSYHTDRWVKAMFPMAFDPCPYDPEWEDMRYDGLTDDWGTGWPHVIFINPPYSNPLPWVHRCLQELGEANMEGRKITMILLLKHDSSTKWYKLLHEAGAHFLMIGERLKHCTKTGAAFPSVMVVLTNE